MRNVLFIVVDCLRADRCWGDNRSCKTPAIDKLCSESTVFTQAISVSSYTVSSFASILTGTYPFVHGLRGKGGKYKLNPNCTTLPEVFRKNGYNTYAEVTGPLLGFLGFERGFDSYYRRDNKDTIYSDWGKSFISKLKNNGYEEPWFLFVHSWEIHDPPRIVLKEYDSSKYGKTSYDRAVSSLDSKLKEIFEIIDKDTLLIITGDHGEGICGEDLTNISKSYTILCNILPWIKDTNSLLKAKDLLEK